MFLDNLVDICDIHLTILNWPVCEKGLLRISVLCLRSVVVYGTLESTGR